MRSEQSPAPARNRVDAMSLPAWLLLASALLAGAVVLDVVARRVRLPLTVVLAAGGFLAAWVGGSLGVVSPLRGERFEEVVVFVFLPLLVMEAALGLSTRDFVANLGPILVLAIAALTVSAALVGAALRLGLGIPLPAALLFGALISATDPVAVVAIFRELGVPRRLLTLVEGESLLNDGVAIVLFTILLAATLGGQVSVTASLTDFVRVFFGGAAIGAVLGFAAAAALPWLGRLPAAALSLAAAYGGFVLADDVLGFSGVMATVTTGLVLGGLAPSRASAEVRATWHELWETLAHVANALLFLLIGLAIDPALIAANLGAIALAAVIVLLARAVAVIPLVSALERFAGIPPVGQRNEAVLVWGGLRGGVALALALALPEELPQREQFVAMTGGVVLITLLLNATTISTLVRRLGLDAPTRGDQFLAGSARLTGVATARTRLADLGLDDPAVSAELDRAERAARAELARIKLTADEERDVVTRRGLFVERATYQHLSDAGLLPPPTTRALLHEVDGQIEQATLNRTGLSDLQRSRPRFEQVALRLTSWLPAPFGADPAELAYAEASARRLAARRTGEALSLWEHLPNVDPAAIEAAKAVFAQWEDDAIASLGRLYPGTDPEAEGLRHQQAAALGRVAAADALNELADVGLLPERLARDAAAAVNVEMDNGDLNPKGDTPPSPTR